MCARAAGLPPRVLLVMPDQWPRALLRAALREAGYDAVGTRELAGAARFRPVEPDRGPVRLVVLDQAALPADRGPALLATLVQRHGAPPVILLARPTQAGARGSWARVLRRPTSIGDMVRAVEELLPLPESERRPLD